MPVQFDKDLLTRTDTGEEVRRSNLTAVPYLNGFVVVCQETATMLVQMTHSDSSVSVFCPIVFSTQADALHWKQHGTIGRLQVGNLHTGFQATLVTKALWRTRAS